LRHLKHHLLHAAFDSAKQQTSSPLIHSCDCWHFIHFYLLTYLLSNAARRAILSNWHCDGSLVDDLCTIMWKHDVIHKTGST